MGEISTRIWLDDRLWDKARRRAVAEGVTIRDLLPRLVGQALATLQRNAEPPAAAAAPAAVPGISEPALAGPPVVALSEAYRCGLCGAEVRVTALSNHLGKHIKERQALEAERS